MSCTTQTNSNELYSSLSAGVREKLMRQEKEDKVPSGTKLIHHGAPPAHVIIIKRGRVELSMPVGDKVVQLGVAEAGGVLGLRAIVAGTQPEFDVTTLEESTLTLIPRQGFLTTLKQHPEIYAAIAKVLSRDLEMVEGFLRKDVRRGHAFLTLNP